MPFRAPSNPYVKDAEAAGRFALDVMKRYRKWVSKGQGSHEEWESLIGWLAKWSAHWYYQSLRQIP